MVKGPADDGRWWVLGAAALLGVGTTVARGAVGEVRAAGVGSTVRPGPRLRDGEPTIPVEDALAELGGLPVVETFEDHEDRAGRLIRRIVSIEGILPFRRKPFVRSSAPVRTERVRLGVQGQKWTVFASQKRAAHHGIRDRIIATNPWWTLSRPEDWPLLFREADGTFTISDGHHRMVAAILRGAPSVPVRVVDVPVEGRAGGPNLGSRVRPGPRGGRNMGRGSSVRPGPRLGSRVRPGPRLAPKVGSEPTARGWPPGTATVRSIDPEDGVWVDVTAKVSPYHETRTTIRGIMPRTSDSAASEGVIVTRVHAAIRASVPEADAMLRKMEFGLVEVRLAGRQVDREYVGSRFDLAIAVAILAALGTIPTPPDDTYFAGGLVSDGTVRVVSATNLVRISMDVPPGLVVVPRATHVVSPDGLPMLTPGDRPPGRWGLVGVRSLVELVEAARRRDWFEIPF